MGRKFDEGYWRGHLRELLREHDVPGASLAVLTEGEVRAVAAGVLRIDTNFDASPDSLFQIGSITKMYTATVLMALLGRDSTTVDTPVAEILPELRLADREVARHVTLRQLLSHTSGISGDFIVDTGRGDDCLARYVEACADVPQTHPLGATLSYCNTGYLILGRVIERLSGTTWDAALSEHLVDPLHLTRTWTLPEDVLRFPASMGHTAGSGSGSSTLAPRWYLMRSAGPAGLVTATAKDVLSVARMHLNGGQADDGTTVVPSAGVEEMQLTQATMPNPHGMADAWGLGWALFDYGGRRVIGHDGDTIGHMAALRVVPDAGVAIALLTNSDNAGPLRRAVLAELLADLCDVVVPPPVQPPVDPVDPPPFDQDRFVGVYERAGQRMEVTPLDGGLSLRLSTTGPFADMFPSVEFPLKALTDDLLLGMQPGATRWSSYWFGDLSDGRMYVHDGSRITPKLS